jgi:hypothetical protein
MVVIVLGIVVVLHPAINLLSLVWIIALQLSRESKTVLPLSTSILVKALQPWKIPSPIDATELGMTMEERLLQLMKAEVPIDVTELGMMIDERLLQPLNASYPIEVRPVKYCNTSKD